MRELQSICLCFVVLLVQPSLIKSWLFAPAPGTPLAEPQEPAMIQQAAAKAQPQQASTDDDLLFLSDDEVVHDKKVLKSLKHVDPKEVEELLDNNPVLEELVLKKIQARLERESRMPTRKKFKTKKIYGYPEAAHQHENNHHEQQQELIGDDLADDDDDDDYGDDEEVVDKKKTDSFKAKLKSKAAKIFKMGSGFKEKYAALRNKYKVKSKDTFEKDKLKEKDKEKHKIPKFYYDASR